MQNLKYLFLSVSVFSLLAFLPGIGSCSKSLISDVQFKVDPNIQTAKVQLNFSNDVQSDLGGSFEVQSGGKDYGALVVEPSTPTSPFNVGFALNLDIVNDPDFNKLVQVDPVLDLPSGQPIPIPNLNRAFARIKMKNEINSNFDIYAYVDAADNGRQWVGVALALKFINNKYFPAGLSISQGFAKGHDGNNRVVGAVYGPKVDNNGNMTAPGGIAVFANLKALVSGNTLAARDKGSKMYLFDGPLAPYYRSHPKDAFAVSQAFKSLINANSYGNHTN